MKKMLLLIIILAMIGSQSVSGYSMTRDIGESYISWTWDNGVMVNVMIDGTNILENTTSGYYYLTGIDPNEEHRIDIYNASNPSERTSDIARTLPSSGLLYMLLAIGFLLVLIVLFTSMHEYELYSIFFAIMGCVLANYARGLCYESWGLETVFWTMIIAYIILGIIAVHNIYHRNESYDWL
jgi:hypothetical protein